jgi:hypothetical protein
VKSNPGYLLLMEKPTNPPELRFWTQKEAVPTINAQ